MSSRGQINSNFYQIVNVDVDGTPTDVKPEYVQGMNADVANVHITGGTNGQVLSTDGNGNLSWVTGGSGGNGTPGGSNTSIQFNDNGSFNGNSTFTFDKVSGVVTIPNLSLTGTLTGTGNIDIGTHFYKGDGGLLSNISATNANHANFANVANVANSVAVANVVGIGNIATINLSGNGSQTLLGNGTWGTLPATYSNANVANFLPTYTGNLTANIITASSFVGNGSQLTNITGANVTGIVANATHANVSDLANSVAGANVTGIVANATHANVADLANSVAGANVTGIVGNATHANVSDSANSVQVANVVGIGNIATINLTGSASNVLYGNGVFAAIPTVSNVANANYAAYAGNVTIGAQPNITSVGNLINLQFNTGVTPVTANAGDMFWDTGEHTVTLGMENGVQQQIGLESYIYVKASSAITNGQVVMFTGASGDNVTAAPADVTSAGFMVQYVIGIATQDIALNGFGYITTFGKVHGLDTNAFNVGDVLWLSTTTPGAKTNVRPVDPNFQIQVATVTKKAGGDGHIQVLIYPFIPLTKLTDVETTSPVTGQALVFDGGNTWVNGYPTYANIANSVAGGNVTGQVANALVAGTVYTNAQPNITSVGTLTNLTVTGNITSGNINGGNLVSANYHSGNGSLLSSLTGSNVTGQVSNALVSGTVYTGAQPNITSTGTLTSLTVSGNITGGNINGGNLVSANYLSGNGSLLTNVAATTAGTVTTNAQPNITSVGTLSSLNVTTANTITSGIYVQPTWNNPTTDYSGLNINVINTASTSTSYAIKVGANSGVANFTVTPLGNVTGSYYFGNGSQLTGITATSANFASYAGNVTIGSQPNITSVGTLSNLNVTGNVSASYYLGNGSALTGITASSATTAITVTGNAQPNITSVGTLSNLTMSGTASISGANLVSANYFTGTLTTGAQPNITSIGTLSSLNVTGNVTASYFVGNGSALTGVTSATVTANDQPNITSTGTLSYLSVQSNAATAGATAASISIVNGSNANAGVMSLAAPGLLALGSGANLFTVYTNNTASNGNALFARFHISGTNKFTVDLNGNVSGNYFIGNGSALTGITASSATTAVTVTGNAQPNITSVGTLASLSVTATITGNISGSAGTAGTAGTVTTGAQPNITSTGTLTSLSVTGNITAGNISGGNLVSANFISGNGSLLTSITGANVSGTVSSATTAGTVTTAAQPNITSLGTLTSLSVTGNITAGNISGGNLVSANYLSGNGSLITGITSTTAVTVTGNAQPNITSTGTLSGVTIAGNGSITLSGTTSSVTGANLVSATNLTGTLTTGAQPNVTSLGTLTVLRVTANVTSGNVVGGNLVSANYFSGNGSLLTSITGANVTGTVSLATTAGTVTTNAQPNITSVGTLSSLVVSGTGNVANLILKTYEETVLVSANTSTSISPDFSTGTIFRYTANASFSFNGFTNAVSGSSGVVIITQDGTGGRTMSSTMKFAGASKTLSTAAGAIDIISVFYDGTTYYATLSKGYA